MYMDLSVTNISNLKCVVGKHADNFRVKYSLEPYKIYLYIYILKYWSSNHPAYRIYKWEDPDQNSSVREQMAAPDLNGH